MWGNLIFGTRCGHGGVESLSGGKKHAFQPRINWFFTIPPIKNSSFIKCARCSDVLNDFTINITQPKDSFFKSKKKFLWIEGSFVDSKFFV